MVSRGKGAVARPETTCKVLSEIPDLPGLKVCSESKSLEVPILLVALSWLTELRWKSRFLGNQRSWRSAESKLKRCLASNSDLGVPSKSARADHRPAGRGRQC